MDDFYLAVVHKEDKLKWAKILLLSKHKYIRMKLIEEKCIQINTIVDKKTSYIIFENGNRAKHVYLKMKSYKKSTIMKELTIFSENVEAVQKLLKTNSSTDGFDILTKTFSFNNFSKHEIQKKAQEMIYSAKKKSRRKNSQNLKNHKPSNKPSFKKFVKPEKTDKHDKAIEIGLSEDYNPLDRKSKINKYIVPTLPKLGENWKDNQKRKRFEEDNNTISINTKNFGDPNRNEYTLKSQKDSTLNKSKSKNPFGDIFKK